MNGPRVVVVGTLWERLVAFFWPEPSAPFEFVHVRDVTADIMALEASDGPLTMILQKGRMESMLITGISA